MSPDTLAARQLLEAEGFTCVLRRGGEVYTTRLRGVRPLVGWLDSGLDLCRFCGADKVVGKATAFLYCLLGVAEVYAGIMSEGALAVLQAQGIQARFGTLVPHIINRQGDGICPFEAAVDGITDPQAALTAIRAKMKELNIDPSCR